MTLFRVDQSQAQLDVVLLSRLSQKASCGGIPLVRQQ